MPTTKQLLNAWGGWCKKLLDLRERLYEGEITIEQFLKEAESIAPILPAGLKGIKKSVKRGDKVVK